LRLPALHVPFSEGEEFGKGVPAPCQLGGGALAKADDATFAKFRNSLDPQQNVIEALSYKASTLE